MQSRYEQLRPPVSVKTRPEIATRDSEPIQWRQGVSESPALFSTSHPKQCEICRNYQARYTCPRCEIPYCSISCYKSHSGDTKCTESFYHDRVAQVVELERKEKRDQTLKLLNRTYQTFENNTQTIENDYITEEELHKILAVAEAGDEEQLAKLMSTSRLKCALDHAITTGELNEYILDYWNPWWRPQLVKEEEDEDLNSEDEVIEEMPLDERLLSIPDFYSIRPKTFTMPDLRFNLIDIVYSFVWTLRLYHGVQNAKETAIDAGSTLLQGSAVLGKDARYESLTEVLAASTTLSTKALQSGTGCNASWQILAQDVALIVKYKRQIYRALFEAVDVLKAATKCMKSAVQKDGLGSIAILRSTRKKLEFYLSWLRCDDENHASLSGDIEAWISDWKDPEEESEVKILS